MPIHIYSQPSLVEPYIDIAQQRADTSRDSLGFLPKQAYAEASVLGNLIVAVSIEGDRTLYAGHLMFGGAFPVRRIYQVFVEESFRGFGVGARLVKTLIEKSEHEHFLSVRASVAADLAPANLFWEKMGFRISIRKSGGRARQRIINVRSRDLEVPSLISLMSQPSRRRNDDLGLAVNLSKRAPTYIIDLNVLFDVVRNRPRAGLASKVISAAFRHLIRLAIAEEFLIELQRHTKNFVSDPILELAQNLWKLTAPDLAPFIPPFMSRICSGYGPVWTGL